MRRHHQPVEPESSGVEGERPIEVRDRQTERTAPRARVPPCPRRGLLASGAGKLEQIALRVFRVDKAVRGAGRSNAGPGPARECHTLRRGAQCKPGRLLCQEPIQVRHLERDLRHPDVAITLVAADGTRNRLDRVKERHLEEPARLG